MKESLEKEVCKSLYKNHHERLENDLRQMGAEENKVKKSINDPKKNVYKELNPIKTFTYNASKIFSLGSRISKRTP